MKKIVLFALTLTSLSGFAASPKFKSPKLLAAYRELLQELPGTDSRIGLTPEGLACEVAWETSETRMGTKKNNWPAVHSVQIFVANPDNPRCNTLKKAKHYKCDDDQPSQGINHNVDHLRWSVESGEKVLRSVDHTLDESSRGRDVAVLRLTKDDGRLSKVSLYDLRVNQWRDGDDKKAVVATCILE